MRGIFNRNFYLITNNLKRSYPEKYEKFSFIFYEFIRNEINPPMFLPTLTLIHDLQWEVFLSVSRLLDIIILIECPKPSSSPLVGQYRKLYSLVNQIQPMLIESWDSATHYHSSSNILTYKTVFVSKAIRDVTDRQRWLDRELGQWEKNLQISHD